MTIKLRRNNYKSIKFHFLNWLENLTHLKACKLTKSVSSLWWIILCVLGLSGLHVTSGWTITGVRLEYDACKWWHSVVWLWQPHCQGHIIWLSISKCIVTLTGYEYVWCDPLHPTIPAVRVGGLSFFQNENNKWTLSNAAIISFKTGCHLCR